MQENPLCKAKLGAWRGVPSGNDRASCAQARVISTWAWAHYSRVLCAVYALSLKRIQRAQALLMVTLHNGARSLSFSQL